MPRQIVINGEVWAREAGRPCAKCGCRTYRVSRRAGSELEFAPAPGPHGQNLVAVVTPEGKRDIAICSSDFKRSFNRDPQAVRTWFDSQRKIA